MNGTAGRLAVVFVAGFALIIVGASGIPAAIAVVVGITVVAAVAELRYTRRRYLGGAGR